MLKTMHFALGLYIKHLLFRTDTWLQVQVRLEKSDRKLNSRYLLRIGPIPTINKWFLLHTREWERRGHIELEQVISYRQRSWSKGMNPKQHAGETFRLTECRNKSKIPKQRLPWDASYRKPAKSKMLLRVLGKGPSHERWLKELKLDLD